ncbi:MAG: macro domain-containing protein [Chloroflexota bacterium]
MPRGRQQAPPSAIDYVTGDILANENNARAFAFGCNAEGVMNTELTLKFRHKYPDLHEEYLRRCHAEPAEFDVGDVMKWRTREGMWVFVLGTQADQYLSLASSKQIDQAFQHLREQVDAENIDSIAMPPIGGGVGALRWAHSRRSLERAFKGWKGKLYVYMK